MFYNLELYSFGNEILDKIHDDISHMNMQQLNVCDLISFQVC